MDQTKERIAAAVENTIKRFVVKLNASYNNQSLWMRKLIVGGIGVLVAIFCTAIIVRAISDNTITTVSQEEIIQPTLPAMQSKKNETLIPLGKMKGEINDEFDAFYVAKDSSGTIYINRHWNYQKMFEKSSDWKPISDAQFKEYQQQLHLLPPGNRRIKR